MRKKDLLFSLSGGANNVLPNQSLGGRPSTQTISGRKNNLFSDVTADQARNGAKDFRCVYVTNNGDQKLDDLSFYVNKDLGGTAVDVGFARQNESQALIVQGNPINGHFQLFYTLIQGGQTIVNRTRDINWVPDVATMSQRIAAVLNSLDHLSGVQCVGEQTSADWAFTITFAGKSGGRSQELLGVVNELGVNAGMTRLLPGGPINQLAVNIGMSNNPPTGVTFTPDVPVHVGVLYPKDFVALWLRRTVTAGTQPSPDKFLLQVFANPQAVTAQQNQTPD